MKQVREALVRTEDIYLAKYWLEIWRAELALLCISNSLNISIEFIPKLLKIYII
jgi:hypothetical protein